ncbi:MAG: lipopolysaccharide heptosyltransferase I [Candidatus Pseudothioglobus sp.]
MRIAIVKLSALGDIVHAMVVLQFIKKFNKHISIDWFVDEEFKELLEHHHQINEVHVLKIRKAKRNKSLFGLFNEFHNAYKLEPYDIVVDMQGLIKSAILARIIKSPVTIGFDKKSLREGIASFFYNKTFNYGYDKNIIERNIAIISFALGFKVSKDEIDNKLPFLFSSSDKKIKNLSLVKKNILIVPGASNKSKCYPAAKFVKLINIVDANFFVLWGNENEKKIAKRLQISSSNKVNMCDQMSLNPLINLISQMDMVIGGDTGPSHMAWALNKPSIILFGPTPGYRNSYTNEINKRIESDSEVNPFKLSKEDFSIGNIDENHIAKIAKRLLKKSN